MPSAGFTYMLDRLKPRAYTLTEQLYKVSYELEIKFDILI
jgi:hypothetical protein